MTQYNISITSDIVCPWCYIGHTRLSRAIANHNKTYPDDTFKLDYKPFYLNPAAQVTSPPAAPFPIPSIPRRTYYATKFGPERALQIEAMMLRTASSEGLTFKFGGQTGPSRNGHRLVHYAQNHGGEASQNNVMLGLWRRYFEQEIDITTLPVLVGVGVEAGLGTAEDIKRYLESGEDAKWVDEVAAEAREKDIQGVPHYEIQGLWEVSGAQEPRAFEQLFERWKGMEKSGKVNAPKGVEEGGNRSAWDAERRPRGVC